MRFSKQFLGTHGGTIFVDGLMPERKSAEGLAGEWCRLFTLPGFVEDLEEFACEIGLRPAGLQRGRMPHFVLSSGRRVRAERHGAVGVGRAQVAEALRVWRAANEQSRIAALREQEKYGAGLCGPDRRPRGVVPVSEEEFHEQVERVREQLRARR